MPPRREEEDAESDSADETECLLEQPGTSKTVASSKPPRASSSAGEKEVVGPAPASSSLSRTTSLSSPGKELAICRICLVRGPVAPPREGEGKWE